jgi:hypothetical protein
MAALAALRTAYFVPRESRRLRPARNFCDAEPRRHKRGLIPGAEQRPNAATRSGAVAVAWTSFRRSMLRAFPARLRSLWQVKVK